MDTTDLLAYYAALLIVQYGTLPNAIATVSAWVGSFVQNQIILQVQNAFSILTAAGAQLDILGTYRGINRNAYGVIPASDWSLPSYSDTLPGGFFGWASYSDVASPMILWLQYNDLDSLDYAMTDPQMQQLILLKAQLDSWDGTLGDLDAILYSFFTTYVTVIDNGNMNMVYQHTAADPDPNTLWKVAVLQNIFPHPSGVGVSFTEV
jgi:hypothetical protein